MRYGLCGAQRVGKTTLAKAFADKHGLQFVTTNTRQVMANLGVDVKAAYPIDIRLDIQEHVLTALAEQWLANDNCIFDRTPLDALAYFEADIQRDSITDTALTERYLAYRIRCFEATRLFHTIALVQPGIAIVEDENAAQGSLPYMQHFNSLCLGYLFASHSTHVGILPASVLNLDDRVNYLLPLLHLTSVGKVDTRYVLGEIKCELGDQNPG